MVSDAHMLFLHVDRLVFVSHFMGLGELVEVRARRTGYRGTRIGLTTHRAPERKGRESLFPQPITVTRWHMLRYASDRGDEASDHSKPSRFLKGPWNGNSETRRLT